MPHEFIEQIAQLEGGEALLINLADGLSDGSVSESLLRPFARACLERLAACDAAADDYDSLRRRAVNQTVFSPPSEAGRTIQFQYARALTARPPGAIVTIVTWHKLWELIPNPSSLFDAVTGELEELAHHGTDLRFTPTDDEMERVAARVNELGPETANFRLSFCLKGEPLPVWITIAEAADLLLKQEEREHAATRLRDWLGLGHVASGAPLFMLRSNKALPDPTAQRLGRPTAWDAINHYWFKHRTGAACSDMWGRTLDLAAAGRGNPACDGAPEAVTPGPLFGNDFECRYLGRVETPPLPVEPHVLDALLDRHGSRPRGFDEVARLIEDALAEADR